MHSRGVADEYNESDCFSQRPTVEGLAALLNKRQEPTWKETNVQFMSRLPEREQICPWIRYKLTAFAAFEVECGL